MTVRLKICSDNPSERKPWNLEWRDDTHHQTMRGMFWLRENLAFFETLATKSFLTLWTEARIWEFTPGLRFCPHTLLAVQHRGQQFILLSLRFLVCELGDNGFHQKVLLWEVSEITHVRCLSRVMCPGREVVLSSSWVAGSGVATCILTGCISAHLPWAHCSARR